MNDPKDPFNLSRTKVFVIGTTATALVCGLVFLAVPPAPRNENVVASPLQGPGSQQGAIQAQAGESPASSQPVLTGQPTPAQNYARYCAQCHGDKGLADTQLARMMTSKPTNLVVGPFKFARTPEAVATLIAKGAGAMPGFGKELGDEQGNQLATFVLTLPENPQASPTKVPQEK